MATYRVIKIFKFGIGIMHSYIIQLFNCGRTIEQNTSLLYAYFTIEKS